MLRACILEKEKAEHRDQVLEMLYYYYYYLFFNIVLTQQSCIGRLTAYHVIFVFVIISFNSLFLLNLHVSYHGFNLLDLRKEIDLCYEEEDVC